jgi:hypothetical protein
MANNALKDKSASERPSRLKVAVTTGTGLVLLALTFFCAWALAAGNMITFAVSVSIILCAIPVGFVVGILASPIDPKEEKTFLQYAKATAAFVSGYVIAQAHEALSRIFSPEFLLSELVGFRILSFVTGFTVALLWTYGWRRYL